MKSLLNIKSLLLILALAILPALSFAQADPPPDFPDEDPEAVPIDGGASLLIGAAVLYGARRMRKKQEPNK